jgi:ABC-type transport system involved in multi-copper enzyme maturation permease subunit
MSRFVPVLAAWMRHNFTWSNTTRAWQERIGFLFVVLAVLTGIFFLGDLGPAGHVIFWGLILALIAVLLRRRWLRLFGPVLFYDLLTLARRRRYFVVRCGYAAFLFAIIGWLWFAWSVSGRFEHERLDVIADFAHVIFELFVSVQFILVVLLTPIYTASAVADEKERRTLEFLLATDLRNREIVLGKLLSRLLNLGILILAGLPVLALLQFLGGVDPQLVLAAYAATLATVTSLACLGTLFSVLVRKGRDAILLTYLCVLAYIIGWAMQLAVPPSWLSFPGAVSPVTLQDVLGWYNAGNIIHAINSLGDFSFRSGRSLNDLLPEVLRNYLIFHCLLALVCATWAVLRLRAIALKETYGKAQKLRLGVRLFGRPAVGHRPMLWKEVFAEPGLRLHWLGRIVVALLVLASFVPLFFILDDFFEDWSRWRNSPYELLAANMNEWGRVVGAMVGSVLLLGVGVRAAGGITGERDRQTLDSLLTTPLESSAILYGKLLGSIFSVRRGWLWLGAIYTLTLAAGGLNVAGLIMVVIAWFVFATFVAMLGLWASTTCRTTMRATVWTLVATSLAFGGHWLLWFCCVPLLWASNSSPSSSPGRGLEHLAEFQLFALTPSLMLWEFAFRGQELESTRGYWNPATHLAFAILGLCIWAGLSAGLWGVVSTRLSHVTNRTRYLSGERPRPPQRLQAQGLLDRGKRREEIADEE